MCRASIDWLRCHLRVTPQFLANQDLSDAQLVAWGLSRRDVTRSLWWVIGRRRWSGHVAIGHLLLRSRRAWPLLGMLILWTPLRPVARGWYRLFAWSRPWTSEWISEQISGRQSAPRDANGPHG